MTRNIGRKIADSCLRRFFAISSFFWYSSIGIWLPVMSPESLRCISIASTDLWNIVCSRIGTDSCQCNTSNTDLYWQLLFITSFRREFGWGHYIEWGKILSSTHWLVVDALCSSASFSNKQQYLLVIRNVNVKQELITAVKNTLSFKCFSNKQFLTSTPWEWGL